MNQTFEEMKAAFEARYEGKLKREFRTAIPADRERILEIYDHIFTAEEQGPVICSWKRGRYPTPRVADEGIESGEMVVQIVDGDVIGSARFNTKQDDVFANGNWEHDVPDDQVLVLHTLTTDPECAGIGGGKAFLLYYEELAYRMGCTELRMDTAETNVRARKIYADCGFKEAGKYEFEEPGSIAAIFLEKYIG